MGNRAVITFSTARSAPCIYLHWNGGRASVEGFLRAARHLNLNASLEGNTGRFDTQAQTMDAIASLLAEKFFLRPVGDTVCRETYGSADTDNHDNGVYVIDADLTIVKRVHKRYEEELDDEKTNSIYAALIASETP